MATELDPALDGEVGSTTTQQLDGTDYRIRLFWLAEETNTPWGTPGRLGAAVVTDGGSYVGADGDYPATQAATSGDGEGATFIVTIAGGMVTAVKSIVTRGDGYVAFTDTIDLAVSGVTENSPAMLTVSLAFADPGVWSESTRAQDGTSLVEGQVLRHGSDTLAGMTTIVGAPQGRLIPYDDSGNSRDPGRNDLDPESNSRLVYVTAEEAGRA
jgi:hypothetical protein